MRFFFNTYDRLKILDEVGREFAAPWEAVIFARQLAADLRCLETAPPAGTGDRSGRRERRLHTPRSGVLLIAMASL